jgi:hypothetical protein
LTDFTVDENEDLVFETKGRLTREDRSKLRYIRASNPNIRIILVFSEPKNKIIRGSPTTYEAWAKANGFEATSLSYLKENPKCLFTMMQNKKDGVQKALPKKSRKS